MFKNAALSIVVVLLLSSLVIAIHTPETRYSVQQSDIEQRNILFTENRQGQGYVNPYGGFGAKGASRGSFGFKGAEEGASVLRFNAYLPQARNPGAISNAYASARGYQQINTYVRLEPVSLQLVSRPQINGTPQGHARVLSARPKDVTPTEAIIMLRVLNLPPIAPDYVYEAWVIDEDTGTSMSLGIFQSKQVGRTGSLDYRNSVPLNAFETIAVTIEPFPDNDPRPGEIIIAGNIQNNVRISP